MTKEEAIAAMLNGSKVTHKYFLPEEFIYMESGFIYDENDYDLSDFWQVRWEEHWNNDWSIYRGEE